MRFCQGEGFEIHHGDCLAALREMEDCSVDAVVSDPPYGLKFMGKKWDYSVPDEVVWRECLRVLKPGGHLLSFAGTRTQHRMAVRIEDAGFEIRDLIMWHYGSGFPKSLDVGKAIDRAAGVERECTKEGAVQRNGYGEDWDTGSSNNRPRFDSPATDAARDWDGWGTALKPATEIITLARKPFSGTIAANVLEYGTGALNIDACRVGTEARTYNGSGAQPSKLSNHGKGDTGIGLMDGSGKDLEFTVNGRFPANLIHDGSDEVAAMFPDSVTRRIDKPSDCFTGGSVAWEGIRGNRPARGYDGEGSAARFFKQCEYDESELLFCRAKAILDTWNPNLANTVDNHSALSKAHVVTVLRRVAIAASRADKLLSDVLELSTNVTPFELKNLSVTLIAAILIIEKSVLPAPPQEKLTLTGSRVKFAAISKQTDIIAITISHWKSDGSAAPVTFSITPPNLAHGAKDLESDNALRFRYCAKASRAERNLGCESIPEKEWIEGAPVANRDIRPNRPNPNSHPTVKPLALMEYLVKLVTREGQIVLDPFMGSGTTGAACAREGRRFIGCEQDEAYCEISRRRIEYCIARAREKQEREAATPRQLEIAL